MNDLKNYWVIPLHYIYIYTIPELTMYLNWKIIFSKKVFIMQWKADFVVKFGKV